MNRVLPRPDSDPMPGRNAGSIVPDATLHRTLTRPFAPPSPDGRRASRLRMPLMTYLALGDSYTIGESVPAAGRWPVQLAAALRGEGVPLAEPVILATTGWTTDELSAAMDVVGFAPPWDLVSLLIGVNTQRPGRHAVAFRAKFRRLLQRAIALADARD